MKWLMRRARTFAGLAAVLVAGAVMTATPAAAATAKPDFQMPFACGETWEGSSRPSHSPSSLSVDWNRDAYDEGHIVIATAPGIVTSVVNLGNTSYGLYVIVDHGGGWTSLHAHLLKAFVVVGQRVDQGQPIALLGNSGGSSGAHLHYEQRFNKSDRHAVFAGKRLKYNSWLRSSNCSDVPIVGDWNGDRISDVGTFGRQATASVVRQLLPGAGKRVVTVGLPTDSPVVGDWNGDGQSDVGAWSPTKRTFSLYATNGTRQTFAFGKAGDLAVAGDWNGDGRDDVGVFSPATAMFKLRDSQGHFSTKVLGSASTWPIAGDWDGDGRDDVGVYDPATTTFSLAMPGGVTKKIVFGSKTSLPVVGNWGADSVTDLGVWNPETGTFSERLGPKRTETVRFGRIR